MTEPVQGKQIAGYDPPSLVTADLRTVVQLEVDGDFFSISLEDIINLLRVIGPASEAVTATGDTQGTAREITKSRVFVTATDVNQGVILSGNEVEIVPLGSIDFYVYPPNGGKIGVTGTTDVPQTIFAGDKPVKYIAVNPTLYV